MTSTPDTTKPEKPSLDAASAAFHANADALRDAGVRRLVVFGSVARGDDAPSSDIDLAVIPDPDVIVGGLRLARWRSLLSEITGRKADAVVSEFLNDTVRAAVEAEGVEAFHA